MYSFEQNKNESNFFLKSETDPDEDFKIMRTLFYLGFCAFKF